MHLFEDYGFVLRGRARRNALRAFKVREMPAIELCRISRQPASNVSRTIAELRGRKLIEPLTKSGKFRYYKITPKGGRVLKEVDRLKYYR